MINAAFGNTTGERRSDRTGGILRRTLAVLMVALAVPSIGCAATGGGYSPIAPRFARPVFVTDPPPPILEAPSAGSPNAALRYMALIAEVRDDPFQTGILEQGCELFDIGDWDDDLPSEAAYRAYLSGRRRVLEAIGAASELDSFDAYPGATGYHDMRDRSEPRSRLVPGMRDLTRLLRDDAIRAWVDGEHTVAVSRIETMFRMAMQSGRSGRGPLLDGLVAHSIMAQGLELLGGMARCPELDGDAASRMRAALDLIEGDDPLGFYPHARDIAASYDAFVAAGLSEPEGGVPLWISITRAQLGNAWIEEVLGQFMAGLEPDTSGQESGLAVDSEGVVRTAVCSLGGIDADGLRCTYQEARPLVRQAIDELAREKPRQSVFEGIANRVSDDETGLTDILHLGVLTRSIRQYQRALAERDGIRGRLSPDTP